MNLSLTCENSGRITYNNWNNILADSDGIRRILWVTSHGVKEQIVQNSHLFSK